MPKVVKEVEKSLLEEKAKLEARLGELQYMFEGSQSRIAREQGKQDEFGAEANKCVARLNEIKEALTPKEEAPKEAKESEVKC